MSRNIAILALILAVALEAGGDAIIRDWAAYAHSMAPSLLDYAPTKAAIFSLLVPWPDRSPKMVSA